MRCLLVSLPLCFLAAPDGSLRSAPSASSEAEVVEDTAPIPDAAGFDRLVRTDPVAFMRASLRCYERDIKGYRCTFVKQERLGGKLQRSEVVDIAFRESPFSVLFDWRDGARLASRVLYVKGQNNDQLLVKPAGWRGRLVSVVSRDAEGSDAKESSRYPMTQFGIKKGTQRAIAAWEAAQKEGSLKYEYRGKRKIAEAGDRVCHVLYRYDYRQPEEDGIVQATLYYDAESRLQVGSTLKGSRGELIGDYWFRDIKANPEFAADAFTRAAVSR